MTIDIDYRPFDGDGRVKALPTFSLPGTQSIAVTRAQARQSIVSLIEGGRSIHSSQGATLWVVITWCQVHGRPFKLTGLAGFGYELELTEVK